MAKFDTQSPPNLVCVDIVQRLGMEDMVLPYEGPQYQGAGGETIDTLGIVKLQWYDSTVAKSRWNEFLVTPPGSPFDLVLGWQWLKEEGVAAFQEPVLALRAMELTPGRFFKLQRPRTIHADFHKNKTEKCKRRSSSAIRKTFH